MNIESQSVQNSEFEMRDQSLPPQPKSSSMLTFVMTMVCVCAGLGIGLAVMLWMPGDDNSKPHYGKKAKTSTSFLSWLTGDDGKKKKKKSIALARSTAYSIRILKHPICCLILLTSSSTLGGQPSRPNIIFFLSDDHRADFLGCAGHPILKTPVIDSLARKGVRFENAFATTSICAASRATLLTGLWERSHKFTFGTPPIAETLVKNSYPTLLRNAGYRTGFVGQDSTAKMFDSFQPLNRSPYWKKAADGQRKHVTDLTGDKAIEFVRGCTADQPFCLSISFNAAHAEDGDKQNQFPSPESEQGLYENVTIPPPLVGSDFYKQLPRFMQQSMNRDRWFWRWDTDEKYQKNAKAYYRMITGLDRNIGRVLKAVNQQGWGDNTVVIFMGDNGYYKGSRGFAGKWSHYEESLRVPLVLYDPRVAEENGGRTVQSMALNVDVPATIVKLATGKVPDGYQGLDFSIWSYRNVAARWRSDFFCEHLFKHKRIPKWEGKRGERYVYVRYFENLPEGEFLHDLTKDPQQLKNFATDPTYAELLASMRDRCNTLRDKYD